MAVTQAEKVPTNRLSAISPPEKGTLAYKQYKVFRKLIRKAKDTDLGRQYHFDRILSAHYDVDLFRKNVPLHAYEQMYRAWWKKTKRGDKDTCWPGRITHFALSSGTTEGASKYIPVSKQMMRSLLKISLRQAASLRKLDLPEKTFRKEVLLIGGSTTLQEDHGRFFGDMSGISAKSVIPKWFIKKYYRPGYQISNIPDWEARVDAIVLNAPKWDVGIICGMPNWVIYILEKICAHHKIKSIHELWPSFRLYVHGGVFIDPYKAQLEALFTEEVTFAETYMASEGFFGYSTARSAGDLKLVLDKGVFFEFIPVEQGVFDESGTPKPGTATCTIGEVRDNVPYTVVIANNSGAWRYLMGDTIVFTNAANGYFRITGRLKHTLNICGEHVSVDNLRAAWKSVALKLNLQSTEFMVTTLNSDSGIRHCWFIAGPKSWNQLHLDERLDKTLKVLNDDYRVARSANLDSPIVHIVRDHTFRNWLTAENKAGDQYKIPAVLAGERQRSFFKYIRFNPERITTQKT